MYIKSELTLRQPAYLGKVVSPAREMWPSRQLYGHTISTLASESSIGG